MEYHGPWTEQCLHYYWLEQGYAEHPELVNDYILIPVPWTDIMAKRGGRADFSDLQKLMDDSLDPAKKYFTVVEHEFGLPVTMPDNVRVYASDGIGQIPLPLLKKELSRSTATRDILCSFMGRGLDEPQHGCDVRMKMYAALRDDPTITMLPSGGVVAYNDMIERSIFSLCPRGSGPTSYRLYESLQTGSIPIYIWEDSRWIPYTDSLDWSTFAIVIHVDELDTLSDRIHAIADDPERLASMTAKVAELVPEWFTYEAVNHRIVRHLCGSYTADLPTVK